MEKLIDRHSFFFSSFKEYKQNLNKRYLFFWNFIFVLSPVHGDYVGSTNYAMLKVKGFMSRARNSLHKQFLIKTNGCFKCETVCIFPKSNKNTQKKKQKREGKTVKANRRLNSD